MQKRPHMHTVTAMSQYLRDSQFISQIVKQVQQMEKERSGGKAKKVYNGGTRWEKTFPEAMMPKLKS